MTRTQCVRHHWTLHSGLSAAPAGRTSGNSASCFQPCSKPTVLPERNSSWRSISPTAAERNPVPTLIHWRVRLLPPVGPWVHHGGGGSAAGLGLVGHPLQQEDCGTKSKPPDPWGAAGQRGWSALNLTQPVKESSWTQCKQRSTKPGLVPLSKMVGTS